jgi:Glu-tRNA(Gln) amidotransferase subunit E-like FAD-binding protein
MKIARALIAVLLLALSLTVVGRSKNKANAKLAMQSVFTNYLHLLRAVSSQTEQVDIALVRKHIEKIRLAFKKAMESKKLDNVSFHPSIEIMQQNLISLERINENGDADYFNYQVKKMMGICLSCHTQLPPGKVSGKYRDNQRKIERVLKSKKEQAMMAYFLRDYDRAINLYQSELDQNLKSSQSALVSNNLLMAILKIYLVNTRRDQEAQDYFKELLAANKLSSENKKMVSGWIKQLGSKKQKKNRGAHFKTTDLKALIQAEIGPIEKDLVGQNIDEYAVDIFRTKRILYEYLGHGADKDILPEILYWLGLIENQEHSLALFSLGDMYLKECIYHWPGNRFAKKCLKAYENSVLAGYTGSAGTHIPNEVKNELKKLKDLINKPVKKNKK